MNEKAKRDISRKLRILEHAKTTGNIAKTCRYFGVSRDSFYTWRKAYNKSGETGLINNKPCPDNPEYAVIERGVPIVFYLMIFTGIAMLLNLLFEARITQLEQQKLDRPKWLQNAFNLTGPLVGALFLSTVVMLFF